MEARKLINWNQLSRLRLYTSISDEDHLSLDPTLIQLRKRETRAKWKSCKKRSDSIRCQFLEERAEYLASKMCTTQEKALRAIIHAEDSEKIYRNIREIFGKQHVPLTQVDILSNPAVASSDHTTVTSKETVEQNILRRNRRHSLQSLSTPFFSHSQLRQLTERQSEDTLIDQYLNGNILFDDNLQQLLTDTEKTWIENLQKCTSSEISLSLSCKDFKFFFA
jgi:hypothetical protein